MAQWLKYLDTRCTGIYSQVVLIFIQTFAGSSSTGQPNQMPAVGSLTIRPPYS